MTGFKWAGVIGLHKEGFVSCNTNLCSVLQKYIDLCLDEIEGQKRTKQKYCSGSQMEESTQDDRHIRQSEGV